MTAMSCRRQPCAGRIGYAGGGLEDTGLHRTPPILALVFAAAACTPTVRVEPPREPITINLNIKLDADVRLRVEEKAREDVKSKAIF